MSTTEETTAHMVEELAHERVLAETVLGKGTVTYVDAAAGYGLVSPDEGDDDLMFRFSGRPGSLSTGMRVGFAVDVGCHGLQAFAVTPVPPA